MIATLEYSASPMNTVRTTIPSLMKTKICQQCAQHDSGKKDDSAEEFLLTREAFVRFVQDSIADAVDKQKRNAYKHGRAKMSFHFKTDPSLTIDSKPTKTCSYQRGQH